MGKIQRFLIRFTKNGNCQQHTSKDSRSVPQETLSRGTNSKVNRRQEIRRSLSMPAQTHRVPDVLDISRENIEIDRKEKARKNLDDHEFGVIRNRRVRRSSEELDWKTFLEAFPEPPSKEYYDALTIYSASTVALNNREPTHSLNRFEKCRLLTTGTRTVAAKFNPLPNKSFAQSATRPLPPRPLPRPPSPIPAGPKQPPYTVFPNKSMHSLVSPGSSHRRRNVDDAMHYHSVIPGHSRSYTYSPETDINGGYSASSTRRDDFLHDIDGVAPRWHDTPHAAHTLTVNDMTSQTRMSTNTTSGSSTISGLNKSTARSGDFHHKLSNVSVDSQYGRELLKPALSKFHSPLERLTSDLQARARVDSEPQMRRTHRKKWD